MKVLIVGLGLIGGSYAIALKKKGYEVYGVDKNLDSINYGLANDIIDYGSLEAKDFICKVDLIIVCLYPLDVIKFIEKYNDEFLPHQIITDVCGVKGNLVKRTNAILKNGTYLSHHPMAGREKIGIKFADGNIFKGANFLIIGQEDSVGIECLKEIAEDMGFTKITVISAQRHDAMIGFTSQLTHAIAVALVNSDNNPDTKNFIGDSYRDLTRIAMINDDLWSELFIENKDELLKHIYNFEKELDCLKDALINEDKKTLSELFKKSTMIRKEMEK